MIVQKSLLRTVVCLMATAPLWADTKTLPWTDPNHWNLATGSPAESLVHDDASVVPGTVGDLLNALGGKPAGGPAPAGKPAPKAKACPADVSTAAALDWAMDDTFVLHAAVWGDATRGARGAGAGAKIQIDKQNWYVYQTQHTSDEDITTRKRIYGTKRVWLVYIHKNIDADLRYDVSYQLAVKGKMTAYLNHLIAIGQLFGVQTKAGGGVPDTKTRWGAHCFDVAYVPSDLTFTPKYTVSATPAGGANPLNFGSAGAELKGAAAETFDDEGLYRFDFSVGVPLKKIKDLTYVSSSNTLTPASVTQQNIFGFFDYYFRPVDIKNTGFSLIPHLVAGVKIGSQPLKKAIIGIGYGPALANFYAGLVLNTTRVPGGAKCGVTPAASPAGAQFTNRTCAEFGWGINIAAGAAVSAIQKK